MTCYLYVLPLAYEDQLKFGISRDPLARAQAFSRRYYEFFDLSRSLLVEFDSRREAQARESALHRQLREWNATQPITVPKTAAGKTEWYRGAYSLVKDAVDEDIASGRTGHAPAFSWWRQRLRRERENLYEWATALLLADVLACESGRMLLADTLDAYLAMQLPLKKFLPPELLKFGGGDIRSFREKDA